MLIEFALRLQVEVVQGGHSLYVGNVAWGVWNLSLSACRGLRRGVIRRLLSLFLGRLLHSLLDVLALLLLFLRKRVSDEKICAEGDHANSHCLLERGQDRWRIAFLRSLEENWRRA